MQNLLRALNTGDVYPGHVSLDEYLSTWFSCLWRLSLVPPVREHGAALVEADGRLSVAAARPGSDAAFPLKNEEMREEGFAGYVHTHPYESGTTGVAFSATDLRVTINWKMKMCIVQSGEDIFMVARTAETVEHLAVDELSDAKFDKQVSLYELQGRSWQGAILETNRDLCGEYGLVFYQGRLRQLRRL